MAACPDEEQLAALVADASGADADPALRDHVSHCPACQAWLSRAARARDWLRDVRAVVGGSALRADREAPAAVINSTAAATAASADDVAAAAPAFPAIPGCEITHLLRGGGQGIVYQARQLATNRLVAVKLLRDCGEQGPSARRRFEREVELAAQLRHPHIISIFQSGYLASGAQYYVMEYVDGAPLQQHVRERRASLEEALGLFSSICDAVHYAHQHGVLHRDLKPTNILVDADGQPKVLDFGLAKPLTTGEASLISVSREILGTLAYMSPEQAAGASAQVDVRSDLYSLGVILYELLTGRYPYRVDGPLPEVVRQICETPPEPPSRVWRRDSGISHRANRRLRVDECPIDSDLQTILLKALAKEPGRRYQSAGDLARDIRHYLADEPIEARRDSTWYMVRKSLRRYRAATAFLSALLLVMAVALGAVVHFWRQAEAGRLVAELSSELTPTIEAKLGGHFANLKRIDSFLAERSSGALRRALAQRMNAERHGLLDDAETLLEANDLAELTYLLVHDAEAPTLLELLQTLDTQRGEPRFLDRLCRRLERWVRMPPPLGRGQEMRDCLGTLLMLDPKSARGRQLRSEWERSTQELPLLYAEEFSTQYASGDVPPHWNQLQGIEKCVIVDAGMLIESTSTASSTAKLSLRGDQIAAQRDVSVLSCIFRVLPGDAQQIAAGVASLRLEGENGLICQGGYQGGRCCLTAWNDAGQLIERLFTALEVDRDYHAEFRYFRQRETVDFLLDGEYVAEEAPCRSAGEVLHICAGTSAGLRMVIRKLEFRSGDAPLKVDLGHPPPLIELAAIPLEIVRRVILPNVSPVLHDFGSDGVPELVAGNLQRAEQLSIVHLQGAAFTETVAATAEVNAATTLQPHVFIDGKLAVMGVGVPKLLAGVYVHGIGLFDINPEFEVTTVFQRLYHQPGRACIAPLRFPDGVDGFAIGLHEPACRVELFRPAPPGAAEPYTCVCRFTPYKPAHRKESNVHSLLPLDCDGDGLDELVIGWGQWDGNCAAIVDLNSVWCSRSHEELPAAGDVAHDDSVIHGERGAASSRRRLSRAGAGHATPDSPPTDRHWVSATPLTGVVGETLLAPFPASDAPQFLVAASRQTPLRRAHTTDPQFSAGHGVHVWRVSPELKRGYAPPVFFKPCDAIALTSGSLCGRDVFVVAFRQPCASKDTIKLILQVYGVEDDRITALWRASFHGVPDGRCDLCLGDANGDGIDDLLVGLDGRGLLVFTDQTRCGAP